MSSLGSESYEALTSPQPQTREKRNSVEVRLFEAQMSRTRKYCHSPCKSTDSIQISDPRVRSLPHILHASGCISSSRPPTPSQENVRWPHSAPPLYVLLSSRW